MDFLTNIDLKKNELQNVVIHLLGTPPANPSLGQIYFDTTDNLIKQYNGSEWKPIGAVLSVAGKTGAVVLVKGDVGLGNVDNTSDAAKKAAFTGDIADNDDGFPTGDAVFEALALKLSLAGGTMAGPIAMGSYKITGLGAPSADGDAATKKYADDLVAGLGTILNFRGTVATKNALPLTGMHKGDVYIVTEDSSEYVWVLDAASGTIAGYEKFGPTVDLDGYLELSGGTMTGPIGMGGNKITGLAAATANGDAVRYEQLTGLIKTATGTISTSGTSVEVAYTGTLINAYAKMGNDIVELDKTIAANKVTFACAKAPSAAVTCVVVYT